MKRKITLLAVLPALFLVGCSQDTNGQAVPVNGTLEGEMEYGEIVLPDGRVLECVTMNRNAGQTQWGGLDCNGWERNKDATN